MTSHAPGATSGGGGVGLRALLVEAGHLAPPRGDDAGHGSLGVFVLVRETKRRIAPILG